jgi:hypothetical protein
MIASNTTGTTTTDAGTAVIIITAGTADERKYFPPRIPPILGA